MVASIIWLSWLLIQTGQCIALFAKGQIKSSNKPSSEENNTLINDEDMNFDKMK